MVRSFGTRLQKAEVAVAPAAPPDTEYWQAREALGKIYDLRLLAKIGPERLGKLKDFMHRDRRGLYQEEDYYSRPHSDGMNWAESTVRSFYLWPACELTTEYEDHCHRIVDAWRKAKYGAFADGGPSPETVYMLEHLEELDIIEPGIGWADVFGDLPTIEEAAEQCAARWRQDPDFIQAEEHAKRQQSR